MIIFDKVFLQICGVIFKILLTQGGRTHKLAVSRFLADSAEWKPSGAVRERFFFAVF